MWVLTTKTPGGPLVVSDPPGVMRCRETGLDLVFQKSQSSSSVASALPMTYEDPEPEKKSWIEDPPRGGVTSAESRHITARYGPMNRYCSRALCG